MKNSKTPKIVVGVGLAAVYAAALAAFMPRDGHDNAVAQNASPTVSTQVVPELAPPAPIVPASADASTSVAEQSAVTSAAAVPAASVVAKTSSVPPPSRESATKSQGELQQMASVVTASPTYEVEVEKPIPASEGNSAGQGTLITAEVESQTVAAPGGTIDVTTNSAEAEPAASVSSQE
jgi:hypothetical protein